MYKFGGKHDRNCVCPICQNEGWPSLQLLRVLHLPRAGRSTQLPLCLSDLRRFMSERLEDFLARSLFKSLRQLRLPCLREGWLIRPPRPALTAYNSRRYETPSISMQEAKLPREPNYPLVPTAIHGTTS